MISALHTGRLVLTPGDPFFPLPDTDALLAGLRGIKFCGDPLTGSDDRRYQLGERFMQLVNFLGCSPAIQLEPTADDKPFCHLVIDGPSPHPRFLHGRNKTFPRCDNCRKRIPQWEDLIARWGEAPETFEADCPHCGHRQSPVYYDWRQSAGFGRLFLYIENIFPHEAIPSPELLQTLQAVSGSNLAWNFFYLQD